jgi:putative transposase
MKYSFQYYFPTFEKVNQIEIGKEYTYVSVSVKEQDIIETGKYLGVDLNTADHVAVISNPDTGKVWKLGKIAGHIHKKYRDIRRRLQRHRKVKQIKDRESRIGKNLNHQEVQFRNYFDNHHPIYLERECN